jgi:hypothetical protein
MLPPRQPPQPTILFPRCRLSLLLLAFGRVEPVVKGHRYAPGRDRVDQETLWSELLGHRRGQGFHTVLGRRVSYRTAPALTAMDETFTILHPLRPLRSGRAALEHRWTALRLAPTVRSHNSSVLSSRVALSTRKPAFYTSTSRTPNRSSIIWAIFSTSVASATSPWRSASLPRAPPFLLPLLPPLRCGCSGWLRHNLALRTLRRLRPIPVPLPATHATSSEQANFFTPNRTHVPFFSV